MVLDASKCEKFLGHRGSRNAAVSFQLLGRQAWQSLDLCDRRGTPFTGERLGLRAIEPHSQVKGSLRCGKPIGFLVLSRTLVLEIEVKRAIGVDLEWHPTSDCEAVQAVSDLKPLRVIESDGTRRRSRVARNSLTMAPQS